MDDNPILEAVNNFQVAEAGGEQIYRALEQFDSLKMTESDLEYIYLDSEEVDQFELAEAHADDWIQSLRLLGLPFDGELKDALTAVSHSFQRSGPKRLRGEANDIVMAHLHQMSSRLFREPLNTTLRDHFLLILGDAESSNRANVFQRETGMLPPLFMIAYQHREATQMQKEKAKRIASGMVSIITPTKYSKDLISILSRCLGMVEVTFDDDDPELLFGVERLLMNLFRFATFRRPDADNIEDEGDRPQIDLTALIRCIAKIEVRSGRCYASECRSELKALLDASSVPMRDFKLMILEDYLSCGKLINFNTQSWWLDTQNPGGDMDLADAKERFNFPFGDLTKTKDLLLRACMIAKCCDVNVCKLVPVGYGMIYEIIWSSFRDTSTLHECREIAERFGFPKLSSALRLIHKLLHCHDLANYERVGDTGHLRLGETTTLTIYRSELMSMTSDQLLLVWFRNHPVLLDFFFERLAQDSLMSSLSNTVLVQPFLCSLAEHANCKDFHKDLELFRRLIILLDSTPAIPWATTSIKCVLDSICSNVEMTELIMGQQEDDEGVNAVERLRLRHLFLFQDGSRMTRESLAMAVAKHFVFAVDRFMERLVLYSFQCPNAASFLTALKTSIRFLWPPLQNDQGNVLAWWSAFPRLLSCPFTLKETDVILNEENHTSVKVVALEALKDDPHVLKLLARAEWLWVACRKEAAVDLVMKTCKVVGVITASRLLEALPSPDKPVLLTNGEVNGEEPVNRGQSEEMKVNEELSDDDIVIGAIASTRPLRECVIAQDDLDERILHLVGDLSCHELTLALDVSTTTLTGFDGFRGRPPTDDSDLCANLSDLFSLCLDKQPGYAKRSLARIAEWKRFLRRHNEKLSMDFDIKLLIWASNFAPEIVMKPWVVGWMLESFSSVLDPGNRQDNQFYLQLSVALAAACDEDYSFQRTSFENIRRHLRAPISHAEILRMVRKTQLPERGQVLALLYSCADSQPKPPPVIAKIAKVGVVMNRVLEFLLPEDA